MTEGHFVRVNKIYEVFFWETESGMSGSVGILADRMA